MIVHERNLFIFFWVNEASPEMKKPVNYKYQ